MRISIAYWVNSKSKRALTEFWILLRLTVVGALLGSVIGGAFGLGLQALGISSDAANLIGAALLLYYARLSGFFRRD